MSFVPQRKTIFSPLKIKITTLLLFVFKSSTKIKLSIASQVIFLSLGK